MDKFNIQWIPVKQLSVVWAESQREFNPSWAKHIAENFDADLFGLLSVTLPNGNGIYHTIDGQHRKAAIQSLWGDDEQVPCQVFNATDPVRAADMFVRVNTTRKRPTKVDEFNISVQAGYEDHKTVNSIAVRAGYKIRRQVGDGIINAPQALMWVYKSFGSQVLTDTLRVIQATFGIESHAVSAQIIRGVGAFLAAYPKANQGRLVEKVQKKFTPGRLIGAARTAKDMLRLTLSDAMKHVLKNTYNFGLKEGKL